MSCKFDILMHAFVAASDLPVDPEIIISASSSNVFRIHAVIYSALCIKNFREG